MEKRLMPSEGKGAAGNPEAHKKADIFGLHLPNISACCFLFIQPL
ncbi:hypothetical protein NMA510612_1975 [Neisseria meningitidis]|uniref:Uncharacterized protein n=1 Tax=Neisseria meningitidis TaxID=487 RepID=X5F8C8_NEIME|nr:hypothetical protein NMA510612_1975 [Neisseria meningitidis]